MDFGVLLFAIGLTGLAGVLFGVLPSWRAMRLNVAEGLKDGARGQSGTKRSLSLQSTLVVSEVALSLLLLSGAGLLITSFVRLSHVDPGFRSDGVLVAGLSFPMSPAERGRLVARYREILDRTRGLPGVEAAGIVRDVPLDPVVREGHFAIENRGKMESAKARWQIASDGTMETLRIPLLRGRRFSVDDTETAQPVAIVSAEMARQYWPDRDPIGERVWFDGMETKEHWLTIVGIAGDVRQSGLTEPAAAIAYVCYTQLQVPAYLSSGTVVVRGKRDARGVAPAMRKLIRGVNPEAAVSFRTRDDVMADATARQRFQMQVLASFAALALLLALVGLYGVMSYMVASNRVAIGIRVALGARPADVLGLVMRRAVVLAGAGVLIGVAASLAMRGVLKKMVFGVGPSEPVVLAGAVGLMLLVALAASLAPAWRAMRVDAAVVLRGE